MKNITMFSWGYWGWGRAMRDFDAATTAVEKSRGFKPPIFIDIRLRRAVRALNMQGDNLAKIVGTNRYVWMNDLGNLSIATRDSSIRIKKPAAAVDLLDKALEAARERRRIIFFCACKAPKDEGCVACHRHVVGSLLLKEAARRGIDLKLVEWPGGESETIGLPATPKQLRSVKSASQRFLLGKNFPDSALHALPWGSVAKLSADDETLFAACGPAKIHARRWYLPIFAHRVPEKGPPTRDALSARRRFGYEARSS